jgi:hypothetical protein
LLKSRTQPPSREESLCCKLNQIAHSFQGHFAFFLVLDEF